MSKEGKSAKKISFINWFITLLISLIPGANIIYFIFCIGCAKNPSKKSFAVAALVLALIIIIACLVAVFAFGDKIVLWAEEVLKEAKPAIAE